MSMYSSRTCWFFFPFLVLLLRPLEVVFPFAFLFFDDGGVGPPSSSSSSKLSSMEIASSFCSSADEGVVVPFLFLLFLLRGEADDGS